MLVRSCFTFAASEDKPFIKFRTDMLVTKPGRLIFCICNFNQLRNLETRTSPAVKVFCLGTFSVSVKFVSFNVSSLVDELTILGGGVERMLILVNVISLSWELFVSLQALDPPVGWAAPRSYLEMARIGLPWIICFNDGKFITLPSCPFHFLPAIHKLAA